MNTLEEALRWAERQIGLLTTSAGHLVNHANADQVDALRLLVEHSKAAIARGSEQQPIDLTTHAVVPKDELADKSAAHQQLLSIAAAFGVGRDALLTEAVNLRGQVLSLTLSPELQQAVDRAAATTHPAVVLGFTEWLAVSENAKRYGQLHTPEINDFMLAVEREALHQRQRWPAHHDAGKAAEHWYWLIGHLASKALNAAKEPTLPRYRHKARGSTYVVLSDSADIESTRERSVVYRCEEDGQVWVRPHAEFFDGRFEPLPPAPAAQALHHTITTAAAAMNWHAAMTGHHPSLSAVGASPDGAPAAAASA